MARRGRRPKGLDDDFDEFNINFEEEISDGYGNDGDTVDAEEDEINLESRQPFADDIFENFDEDDY
jgi:hypothetical protein